MTRADLTRQGFYTKWSARYGMSPSEVDEARSLARKANLSMSEACRMIVLEADRAAERRAVRAKIPVRKVT